MAKLSKDDKAYFYDFLSLFETELKIVAGQFNIKYSALQNYIKEEGIYLETLSKEHKKKISKYRHWILYGQRVNDKISHDDKVHHLLRHLRNAIAHALITKEAKQRLMLIDKHPDTGKLTMEGKIDFNVFKVLLELLISSKKHK